ncbi:MAG: hypothetical protein U1C51_04420 [Candidatus Izemoplasmatales bacterium]|nr:hypothetical protein [Methylobacter sp.]MDP2426995.1 hypothetical protein [Methylobacter sp.]MDP3055833.1 hypothetical protein [Methylobacter sp.]MDP3361805.1 hypothetical protein [Methylobacter sp.]MDZ4196478.1 hypothetical protein [Candidatus Izemoplasmatales bacterium]
MKDSPVISFTKAPIKIKIDDHIDFEVGFNLSDREVGYDDDIRFTINETGDRKMKILKGDRTSLLLTQEQAVQLAQALIQATEESRSIPRKK